MKTNSEIYCEEEADNYFDRNSKHLQSIFTEYLLEIFPRNVLNKFEIAEFGIGNGQNLFFLKHFCKKVHGYEASGKAVLDFKKQFLLHPCRDDFSVAQVNLSKPIDEKNLYDLIIYGFFQYYLSDNEMGQVMNNTRKMLKPNSYVYVYDFIVRNCYQKVDKRNKKIKIYKRNIGYWVDYFKGFDLVDFKLFDDSSCDINKYGYIGDLKKINPSLSSDDDRWLFAAVFKSKEK